MALENLCTGWGCWGSTHGPHLACLLPGVPTHSSGSWGLQAQSLASLCSGGSSRQKAQSAAWCVWVFSCPVPTKKANKLCRHVATLRHSTFLNAELQLRQGPSVYWSPLQMSEGFLTTYHLQWTSLKPSKVTDNQLLPSTWVSALTKELSWSGLSHLGCQSRPFSPVHVLLNLCISVLRQ